MKKTILVAILLISSFSFSQQTKKEKTRRFFSNLFYSESALGVYLGVPFSYEKSNFSMGAEVKLYGSYYVPILSGSVYLNYRKLLLNNVYQLPNNNVSIGGHFALFGLELGALFNNESQIWRITPKLGYDWGNISLFYGYDINLNSENKRAFLNHNIQLKYSIFIPISNN